MTQLDTIFDNACTAAGLSWLFVYDTPDRNIKIDGDVTQYPCVLRLFRETVRPLFDQLQRVERSMSLYIVHAGFTIDTSEQLNINLDEIMNAFIIWRESMRRAGVEVIINGAPFPTWEVTDMDEYGYTFDLTLRYSICQY